MSYNIEADKETLLSDNSSSTNQRKRVVYCLSAFQVVLIFTAIGIVIFLQILSLGFSIRNSSALSKPSEYAIWKDCGHNASEARSHGCIFDVMMTGWVKLDCYNRDLSEEYLLEGDFKFFSDQDGTKEIPLDILRLGEHTHMWTNDLHHRAHCVYVWKLQALALESQAKGKVKLIDSESYTLDHTEHCARILVNSIPSPPYPMNYGEVDFLSCGPYQS
ncbi:hypothetical protein VTL71DRAFT_5453 [Oculimacula yallundae]|uniref:Uncharacterized protein n=1 Tax=Oculimacula yallundae TaxID=86028 RepID=A0ABR4C142_9HELO